MVTEGWGEGGGWGGRRVDVSWSAREKVACCGVVVVLNGRKVTSSDTEGDDKMSDSPDPSPDPPPKPEPRPVLQLCGGTAKHSTLLQVEGRLSKCDN